MASYDESDLEALYDRGDWHSWQDIVGWIEGRLKTDDQAGNEFSERETQELLEGLRHLADSDTEFTSDPNRAYQLLQGA